MFAKQALSRQAKNVVFFTNTSKIIYRLHGTDKKISAIHCMCLGDCEQIRSMLASTVSYLVNGNLAADGWLP